MPANKTFHSQRSLAKYCRNGEQPPRKGVHKSNIEQYRKLVYNVVDDMLQSTFPITFNFLSELQWDQLVDDFFSHHACESPQVWNMPKEFYQYHQKKQQVIFIQHPFLPELIWFEWLEMELFMMEDKPVPYSEAGSIHSHALVLNPEHYFQYFQYPVHRKRPSEISDADQGHYFLVLHREPESGNIRFTEVAAPVLRMLELLAQKPLTAAAALAEVGVEFGLSLNEEMRADAFEFFQQALDKRLILGYELTTEKRKS